MSYKILVINSMWSDILRNYGVDVLQTSRKLNYLERGIKIFVTHFKFLSIRLWDAKKWWEKCRSGNYDVIILMDSTRDIIYQSQKIEQVTSPDTRLILYLLNPVSYLKNQHTLISKRWEVWSFSKKDSSENGFKYGETFYIREFAIPNANAKIKYDSFFIGLDKGRMKMIGNIEVLYRSKGLNPFFYIADNKKYWYNRKYRKRISYTEVVKLVQASKSITDILQKNQEGMTLRVMESIFLKRKLITTNSFIKERKIYQPENVFILGEDDNENLYHFINTPYKEIDKKEVGKYEFSSWLCRIVENKKFE